MRRDCIKTADMEHQPLRYWLSGDCFVRDYPQFHRTTRCPRVDRPVVKRQDVDASGCQEKIDKLMGSMCQLILPGESRTARTIASIGAAMIIGMFSTAPSHAEDGISPGERCLAANLNFSLGAQLPRTAARLRS